MLARTVGILVLVPFGVALGLCLVEGALRVRIAFDPRYQSMYDTAAVARDVHVASHPFVPFTDRPNATFERHDAASAIRVTTNGFGYRTREFAFDRAASSYSVVVLGGSATYGISVPDNDDTWPVLLEQRLADAEPRVRVYNLATEGATTTRHVVEMSLFGVRLAPDLVVAEIGCDELAALGSMDFRPDHAHLVRDTDRRAGSRFLQERLPPAWLDLESVRSLTGAGDRGLGVFDLHLDVWLRPSPAPDPLSGIDATIDNLRALHTLARENGARVLFVILFNPSSETMPHAALRARLEAFLRDSELPWSQIAVDIVEAPSSGPRCTLSAAGQHVVADSVITSIEVLR